MSSIPLVRRVEVLEDHVSALNRLPERVAALESALAAFRGEVRAEFTGVQGEFTGVRAELTNVRAEFTNVRAELTGVHDKLAAIDGRLTAVESKLVEHDGEFAALRVEIRAGDEETRRQMRVLHEEVLSRIALLQEGFDARARGRRRKN
jgi:chromosome segregation ATPase